MFRLSSGVAEYSVADMSKSGAKVLTASEEEFKHFPIGENLRKAVIRLGKKASVSVLDTIPRVHYAEAVGLTISWEQCTALSWFLWALSRLP